METQLTNREREILMAVARGRDNTEVASALGVSELIVRNSITQVIRKLRPRGKVTRYRRRTGAPAPQVVALLDRAERLGLTSFALSRAVGAHPSVLNRWRTGTSPRLDELSTYERYLDTVEAAE